MSLPSKGNAKEVSAVEIALHAEGHAPRLEFDRPYGPGLPRWHQPSEAGERRDAPAWRNL